MASKKRIKRKTRPKRIDGGLSVRYVIIDEWAGKKST